MTTKNKPTNTIRLGSIKAAIWANPTKEKGIRYSVTVCRIYKDGEEWKQTESFGRDDLLVVAKAADLAFLWIAEQGKANAKSEE